jgi:hypothetical protein
VRINTIQVRLGFVLLSVASMLLFSHASGITLIAMAIGTATVFLGMQFSYRQAAAAGVLVISGAAASAIEVTTLTDLGSLETAAFGLVVPVMILTLVALSGEREGTVSTILRRRPTIRVAFYIVVCLFAAPLTVLLISLFAPGISAMMPMMAEASVVLAVTIAAVVVLTWREPRTSQVKAEE